ncbi:hypothetical protein EV667_3509 [Ancylobacter aquaticus]|uniref:SIR2-like domain-containing protein n=1 Tax=Ancylobacter aquaticus TaxID=100 RepID=A0A4R1HSV4_ANCAQ|nr:hypothetical protein [Ancylobacter aquaticus]TCK23670.1 hypothetical protein EV667_3509 [Ancylobacter aquaticus]
MFKSKTIFVVGAGASKEARLPTGEDLKDIIVRMLLTNVERNVHIFNGDVRIARFLQLYSRQEGLSSFSDFLLSTRHITEALPVSLSIDNFLDAHAGNRALELCGKMGIVAAILDSEASSKFVNNDSHDDRFLLSYLSGTWYVKFFQLLTEGVSKDNIDNIFENVSFIIFNYDRCIERFLVEALFVYYKIDRSYAEFLVSKLDIFHPYGTVGDLPWQNRSGSVNFGDKSVDIYKISAKIKTFTEQMYNLNNLNSIRDNIINSNTIIFLGFAFHPMNMEIMSVENPSKINRIFATTFKMSDADEFVVEQNIWRMLGRKNISAFHRKAFKPQMSNSTCVDFFNRYMRSLAS